MSCETSKNDGAGGNAPAFSGNGGALVCIDAAEARLMRRHGHKCITSPKLRDLIIRILESGANNAVEEAVNAIGRLGGVSSADDPARWSVWEDDKVKNLKGVADVRAALAALPIIPTLLRDPEEPVVLNKGQMWNCSGTTVLIARDTFELVRVADTYAKFNCYRPQGRMDEPFTPSIGRVCLITEDELRLLRLEGVEGAAIVLTYTDEHQGMTGREVTRHTSPGYWSTGIRALCGEYPGLTVGTATYLVCGRQGYPFVLGLTRGVGFESSAKADVNCPAGLAYRIQTNRRPEAVSLNVVIWAGGDDVRQLVRYGGLTIFTGRDSRRKVQLRSLGLIRSGTVAGVPIYDLRSNYNTLTRWAITRTFVKPDASQRDRDHRRVRCKRASPESTRGTYIIQDTSPRRIRVTPSKERQAALRMRETLVWERLEDGGVTTVHLKNLNDGGAYCLNGRPAETEDGKAAIDGKRSKIRAPRWKADDTEGMLAWLGAEKCVVMAGVDAEGCVFAVVRVANGTEDQQAEAIGRWSEDAGRRFPRGAGCASLVVGCLRPTSEIHIQTIRHTNWRALPLETACFERYQTAGDYSKPVKIERRATATLSERARAYADRVPLADEGTRNQNLHGVSWNVGELFGLNALVTLAPLLLSRSTLPEKEKRTIINRAITRTERKENHDNDTGTVQKVR